jgi:hypothetical protein
LPAKGKATANTPRTAKKAAEPAAAAQLPPRVPPVDAGSLDFVVHRQERQAEKLQQAPAALRFWARRGEKQAVRDADEEPSPADGRDGDVPEALAAAQRLLWDGGQRLSEELTQLHTSLRQLVCRQYQPLDQDTLKAVAEACSDGQRIPAQADPRHGRHCLDLRTRAKDAALSVLDAKEVLAAAPELFQMEFLLLEGGAAAGGASLEIARVKSQFLLALAQVLVDGSTPPMAAPCLTQLFERAIATGAAALDADAKAQLVPRITRAMGAGGRSPLREREAVLLLRASLDPDALLEGGRLREFLASLRLVVRLCRDVEGAHAAPMLRSFDAQRLAALVVEKAAPGGGGAGGSSSSSSSGGGKVRRPEQTSLKTAACRIAFACRVPHPPHPFVSIALKHFVSLRAAGPGRGGRGAVDPGG